MALILSELTFVGLAFIPLLETIYFKILELLPRNIVFDAMHQNSLGDGYYLTCQWDQLQGQFAVAYFCSH